MATEEEFAKLSKKKSRKKAHKSQSLSVLIFFGTSVLCAVLSFAAVKYSRVLPKTARLFKRIVEEDKSLKYWGVSDAISTFNIVNNVFNRLGYTFVDGSDGDEWDVLWSHENPFPDKKIESSDANLYENFKGSLKSHQKINHFPGLSSITSKAWLTTRNRENPYILPAFHFPEDINEFEDFVKDHPDVKFVVKNIDKGGVKLVNIYDMNFDDETLIYQKFMENPLLIDGKAFELSVYILISSIDPLRIYRFDNELQVRFCKSPYKPLKPQNTNQYVVSESHTELANMPSLNRFLKMGYSVKDSLEETFAEMGCDLEEFWTKLDDAVVSVILNEEKDLVAQTAKLYNSSHNFFELIRVDFLIDKDFKPHIVEANAFEPQTNEKLVATMEHLVYNTLKLVGASNSLDFKMSSDLASSGIITEKANIGVTAERCNRYNCSDFCLPKCVLCPTCLSEKNMKSLQKAHQEHTRRGEFKRIFPSENYFESDFIAGLTPNNQISVKWFKEKCYAKIEWC